MSELLQQDIITGVRFTGALDMLVITFVLAIIYHGKIQSKTYNLSRWLLFLGTLMLAAHNGIQFVGHFRESSPTTAWVINVFSYAFTASMYGLAELNLLRAGHKMRKIFWINIAALSLICILMIVGYFTNTLINDACPWKTMTCGMAAVYTILLIFLNFHVTRDLKATNAILTDDELRGRYKVLDYTGRCMHCIMIVSVITPWLGISSSLILHSILGTVIFVLFLWYLASFLVYGHDMAEVINIEDEIYVATMTNEFPTDEKVAEAVQKWVEERHYLNPNLTIKNALDQMNISPEALNQYLMNEFSISGYRQWIPMLRIEEAKRLMKENPNFTMDAIADMCGLSNGSALARTFRAQTGMTPTQWTKQKEKTISAE